MHRGRVVVALFVSATVFAACHSSAKRLTPMGRPTVYRITYDVEQLVQQPPLRTREQLSVKRPLAARLVSWPADTPPTAPPTSGTLATADALYTFTGTGLNALSGRPPTPPTGDQALGTVLADGIGKHQIALIHQTRVVAGRSCVDVRVLEPPAGPMKRLNGKDHDDLCLDADGLLLREEWSQGGRVLERRTATKVDIDPPDIDADLSTAGAQAQPSGPAPAVGPVNGNDSFLPTPPTPDGYTARPVVGFVLPDTTAISQTGPNAPPLYLETVWSFTRGPDLISVEAGVIRPGNLPWDANDPHGNVSTKALGKGQSVARSDGADLRFTGGEGQFIRIRGTTSVATLLKYANLVPAPKR
jgi:hypothetical protein